MHVLDLRVPWHAFHVEGALLPGMPAPTGHDTSAKPHV